MFEGAEEMVEKVGYYLEHADEREAVAEAGHVRCLQFRKFGRRPVRAILAKVEELRGAGAAPADVDFASAVNAP